MTIIPRPGSFFARSYKEYKDLSMFERERIKLYFKAFDKTPFAKMIRDNAEMSQGMRNFIADVLEGKIKRGNGQKASHLGRDKAIWLRADELHSQGIPWRENAKKKGVHDIVGDEFKKAPETIKDVLERINNQIEKAGSMLFFDDDGNIICWVSGTPDPDDFVTITAPYDPR